MLFYANTAKKIVCGKSVPILLCAIILLFHSLCLAYVCEWLIIYFSLPIGAFVYISMTNDAIFFSVYSSSLLHSKDLKDDATSRNI